MLQSAWRLLCAVVGRQEVKRGGGTGGGSRVVFVYWPHCRLYNCICHGQLNSVSSPRLSLVHPPPVLDSGWGYKHLASIRCDFSLMGLCKLCRSSSAFRQVPGKPKRGGRERGVLLFAAESQAKFRIVFVSGNNSRFIYQSSAKSQCALCHLNNIFD